MAMKEKKLQSLHLEFSDGTKLAIDNVEGFYRVMNNCKTKGGGSPKIIESWQDHEVRFITSRQQH